MKKVKSAAFLGTRKRLVGSKAHRKWLFTYLHEHSKPNNTNSNSIISLSKRALCLLFFLEPSHVMVTARDKLTRTRHKEKKTQEQFNMSSYILNSGVRSVSRNTNTKYKYKQH